MSNLKLVSAEDPAAKPEAQSRLSLTSSIYLQIRTDLLSGKFPPGARLAIKELQDLYGTGATPIREVLTRLAAEGFVVQIDQRGFRVPSFSLDALWELTKTRCLLNEISFREAVIAATDADHEAIIVAHFRMSRVPLDMPGASGTVNPDAEQAHRRFHRALIAGCRLQSLLDFDEKLFEQSTRYRILAASSPPRGVATEHQEIMEAVLERDAPKAIKIANFHIVKTAENAAAALSKK